MYDSALYDLVDLKIRDVQNVIALGTHIDMHIWCLSSMRVECASEEWAWGVCVYTIQVRFDWISCQLIIIDTQQLGESLTPPIGDVNYKGYIDPALRLNFARAANVEWIDHD